MEQEQNSSVVWFFLRSIIISVVVILIAVGLICWVVGWTTAYQYGTAVIVGGLVSIVFGLFSVAGGMRITRSYTYQSAEQAGMDTIYDRTRESQRNLAETYQAMIILGSAGATAIVLGLLVRLIFG